MNIISEIMKRTAWEHWNPQNPWNVAQTRRNFHCNPSILAETKIIQIYKIKFSSISPYTSLRHDTQATEASDPHKSEELHSLGRQRWESRQGCQSRLPNTRKVLYF